MLYLIESGIYAKIGYSTDYDTFKQRVSNYRSDNPSFRIIDTTNGTLEDEALLHSLYKDYLKEGTEWSYAKDLVADIWIKYRASKEEVDYYTEFGLSNNSISSSRCNSEDGLLNAITNKLITNEEIDLFTKFEQYYENKTN